jgi:hypothetical protein
MLSNAAAAQGTARVIYPELPDPLTSEDLHRLFSPSCDDRTWAPTVGRTPPSQVGLLVQLKVFQTIGRFRRVFMITIPGEAAWVTQSAPKRLVSICALASASLISSIAPNRPCPALLITTSRRPNFACASWIAAVTAPLSVTSSAIPRLDCRNVRRAEPASPHAAPWRRRDRRAPAPLPPTPDQSPSMCR